MTGITIRRRYAQKVRNRALDFKQAKDIDNTWATTQVAHILFDAAKLAKQQGISLEDILRLARQGFESKVTSY